MTNFGKSIAMFLVCGSSVFASQPRDVGFWSMPGVTGVVDESSMRQVVFYDTGSAGVRRDLARGTVKLRYPVTNGPSSFEGFDAAPCMKVSARDTGASARVIVRFQRIKVATGARHTLATYNSDVKVPSDRYQIGGVCRLEDPETGGDFRGFNYADYNYYVEVEMTKTDASGNPGIKHVGLFVIMDSPE